MNWLERARREIRSEARSGTVNTAERNPTAVTAVPPGDLCRENEEARRDAFEERAAIMQFDGGLSREEAERSAWSSIYGQACRH